MNILRLKPSEEKRASIKPQRAASFSTIFLIEMEPDPTYPHQKI
jgi:hypothetical protein